MQEDYQNQLTWTHVDHQSLNYQPKSEHGLDLDLLPICNRCMCSLVFMHVPQQLVVSESVTCLWILFPYWAASYGLSEKGCA